MELKSIADQMETLADTICRDYCRYTATGKVTDEELELLLSSTCDNCPVQYLM